MVYTNTYQYWRLRCKDCKEILGLMAWSYELPVKCTTCFGPMQHVNSGVDVVVGSRPEPNRPYKSEPPKQIYKRDDIEKELNDV